MNKLKALLDSRRPIIMGILNVTPDSFSDGGQYSNHKDAESRIEAMLRDGADIIDIGGESTRPGANEVTLEEELNRVIPLVQAARSLGATVSVDTSKAEVMTKALELGVELINDVRALQEPGALKAVASGNSYVCLMHMQGKPRTMQSNPQYDDVVVEVQQMLSERVRECERVGIGRQRIILDPGFGFGKSLEHNCQLMNQLEQLTDLQLPVLVGVSRKRMIGQILDKEVDERTLGSVVAAVYAVQKGAKILRVHDVAETRDAMTLINTFEEQLG